VYSTCLSKILLQPVNAAQATSPPNNNARMIYFRLKLFGYKYARLMPLWYSPCSLRLFIGFNARCQHEK